MTTATRLAECLLQVCLALEKTQNCHSSTTLRSHLFCQSAQISPLKPEAPVPELLQLGEARMSLAESMF
jgi:hypothetical protein